MKGGLILRCNRQTNRYLYKWHRFSCMKHNIDRWVGRGQNFGPDHIRLRSSVGRLTASSDSSHLNLLKSLCILRRCTSCVSVRSPYLRVFVGVRKTRRRLRREVVVVSTVIHANCKRKGHATNCTLIYREISHVGDISKMTSRRHGHVASSSRPTQQVIS